MTLACFLESKLRLSGRLLYGGGKGNVLNVLSIGGCGRGPMQSVQKGGKRFCSYGFYMGGGLRSRTERGVGGEKGGFKQARLEGEGISGKRGGFGEGTIVRKKTCD